jgi:chromosome segregation ATPase
MTDSLQIDFFDSAYSFWDEAQQAAQSSLVLAAKAGDSLLNAKANTKHGEFEAKIERDGRIGIRKAQQCMQIAKNYPELLSGKAQTFALLDFSKAVMLLSADEETKAIVQEKLDAGETVSVKEIERLKREAEEARNKLIEARGKADSQQGIIDLLERKLSEKPAQVVVEKEVIPEDYESLKEKSQRLDKKSSELEKEITTIKDRMKADIDRGVKTHLKERQDELDAMQRKLERLRDESEKCKAEIVGANRHEQELKAQVQAIEDANFALNKLAVALTGFEFMPEGHVLRQWQTLQQSLQDGSATVKTFTSLRLAS